MTSHGRLPIFLLIPSSLRLTWKPILYSVCWSFHRSLADWGTWRAWELFSSTEHPEKHRTAGQKAQHTGRAVTRQPGLPAFLCYHLTGSPRHCRRLGLRSPPPTPPLPQGSTDEADRPVAADHTGSSRLGFKAEPQHTGQWIHQAGSVSRHGWSPFHLPTVTEIHFLQLRIPFLQVCNRLHNKSKASCSKDRMQNL